MIPGIKRPRERTTISILCLVWGVVNFEMLGITYVTPFIASSLRLSNSEIGALFAWYWIPFGLSSYVAGHVTDVYRAWKPCLLAALILFSVASAFSGFASSFALLLLARLPMGLIEGSIMAIVQAITALESPAERRGLNMGIVLNLGSSILGAFVAPLVLVKLAETHGWQSTFFVAPLPGMLCAALVLAFIGDPRQNDPRGSSGREPEVSAESVFAPIWRVRNIWLCGLGSCFVMAHVIIGFAYLPLFYVRVRQLSPELMSWLMSILGVSNIVLGIALPALADRFGRKPITILSGLLGILCPLAALYCTKSIPVLGLLGFVGWAPASAIPIFLATVPAESVPHRSVSTAIGFITGLSTLVGGTAIPLVAGWTADRWGLSGALLLETACAALTAAICLFLRETLTDRGIARQRLA